MHYFCKDNTVGDIMEATVDRMVRMDLSKK